MEIVLKTNYKKTFQWRSKWLKPFWMLIPSISKAKTNYYGIRSAGTVDYRHGAKVRPSKLVLNGIGNEVSKKKEHKCSGSRTIFSRSVVHGDDT